MKKVIIACIILAVSITSLVVFAFSDKELLAQIETFKVVVNGSEKAFEKPIVTINDNAYIPLREAAEMLGMEVHWDGESQTITINRPSEEEEAMLFPFESNGRWGYMNAQGEVIVEPEYVEADTFSDGLALVRKSPGADGQYGYIDQNGNVVIPCSYYMAYPFHSGAALVSLATHTDEDRWTYIDKNGNRLFEKEFILARSFSEDYAVVLKEGYGFPVPPDIDIPKKWSYIDKSGNFATELDFEEARGFCNGYAMVKNDGKWGVIDKDFNLVVPYQYNDIGELENALFDEKEG